MRVTYFDKNGQWCVSEITDAVITSMEDEDNQTKRGILMKRVNTKEPDLFVECESDDARDSLYNLFTDGVADLSLADKFTRAT